MNLLKSMYKPDRATKKRNDLISKRKEALSNLNESNKNLFGKEATETKLKNLVSESMDFKNNYSKRIISAKQKKIFDRKEASLKKYNLLSEQLSDIIIGSLPLDTKILEERKSVLKNSVQHFLVESFKSNILKVKSFVENPSHQVRVISNYALEENVTDNESLDFIKEEISDIIKQKTTEVIKDEVKAAQEKKKLLDSTDENKKKQKEKKLNENDIYLSNISFFKSVPGNPSNSVFNKILKNTSRFLLKEQNTLDMDEAIGNASVQYSILECLNTLNIEVETDLMIKKLTE